jgi:Ca-activated chloride channel family protein
MKAARLFLAIFLLAVPAVSVRSQDIDEVIHIETELIEVPIKVTDKTGNPLTSLTKKNFVIYEDGSPQELVDFSSVSAPFEVALLLDTSGSTRSDLQLIKRSALNFIESLRPGDRVAIISFKTERNQSEAYAVPEVVCELTDDRAALKASLERIKTSSSTAYYDGLIQIAKNIYKDPPEPKFRGRRALVALTDAVDSVSVSDFADAKELLDKAGIICYFIAVDTREYFEQNLLGDCQYSTRFSEAQIRRYYKQFGDTKIEKVTTFCQLGDFERLAVSKTLYELAGREMANLAETSGGAVFSAASVDDARIAFKKVAAEIGTQYKLGYYSSNSEKDGKYRKIKVELQGVAAGATIRAREGYMAIRIE